MSCCDDLRNDINSGNLQIASKAIKWDDAGVWGLAGALSTTTGGVRAAISGGGAGFISQNKDSIEGVLQGNWGLTPMPPEQWMFVLLNGRDSEQSKLVWQKDSEIPYPNMLTEKSWEEFWDLESEFPNQRLQYWVGEYEDDYGSWATRGQNLEGINQPSDWRMWSAQANIPPIPMNELGTAYGDFLFGPLFQYIDPEQGGDALYNSSLGIMRQITGDRGGLYDAEIVMNRIAEQLEYADTQTIFDELRLNPSLLALLGDSFDPFQNGDFSQFAIDGGGYGALTEQPPLFNSIVQALVDNESIVKQFLVNDLLATEDYEGNYLFDQMVEDSMNRAMGFDPETGLNPLAFDGMDPADFADLYPDETYQTPSLQSIVDVNSIKADIKKELDTAGYIKKSAVRTMISEAIGGIVHPEANCNCGDDGSEPYSETPDDLSNGPC